MSETPMGYTVFTLDGLKEHDVQIRAEERLHARAAIELAVEVTAEEARKYAGSEVQTKVPASLLNAVSEKSTALSLPEDRIQELKDRMRKSYEATLPK